MAVRERASTTRKVVLTVFCLAVLIVPTLGLSGVGLGWIEGWSDDGMKDRGRDREAACAWQWRVAVAYAYTFRPEKAAAAFERAYEKYLAIGDLESAGRARYEQAVELEEADKKYEARVVYESIVDDFDDEDDLAKDATHALMRLKYLGRP